MPWHRPSQAQCSKMARRQPSLRFRGHAAREQKARYRGVGIANLGSGKTVISRSPSVTADALRNRGTVAHFRP